MKTPVYGIHLCGPNGPHNGPVHAEVESATVLLLFMFTVYL